MLRVLVGLALLNVVFSKTYIVDNKRDSVTSERTGTLARPFKTIKECIDVLKTPGDECHIRKGNYHEEIVIKNLRGNKNHPYVIRGYKDERPVLDGTVALKNLTTWIKNGNIFSAKVNAKIWQLFFDNTMMTNARWPNAKWSDKSIFDGKRWPELAVRSDKGHVVNKGNSLAATRLNMNGALAIMNIGSFETFVAKVEGHAAKKNEFYFKDTFGDYHFSHDRSRYFLEDKLELLDAEEEWFYDKSDSMLYMYPPNGKHPSETVLRGKVQSYVLTFLNCEHILLKNIDFFATAVKASVTERQLRSSDINFDSLNFRFHTYSKRMLGEIGLTDWLELDGVFSTGRPETWGTFSIFNSTFYGSDGLALSYYGRNVTVKNNLFEYNDWSAANMIKSGGGLATIKSFGRNDLFERNTLRYNGASVGIRPGPGSAPTVRLNDISKQCWGLIQNDGAGVQLTRKPQVNSTLEFNWVHDQPKYGLRFDGEPPKLGTYGSMTNNVVYRCNGLMAKGEHHTVSHNTAFDKVNAKDDDKQGDGCTLCVLKYVRKNPVPINHYTVVTNNLADVANGGKIIGGKGKVWPVAGGVISDNVLNVDAKEMMMDAANNDFRPKKYSPAAELNAGAYPYNPRMQHYWIPGRKLYKSSSPVPVDGSVTVRTEFRDALMWLNGLGCSSHHVYFGAEGAPMKYLDSTEGENNNVVYLPKRLSRRTQYLWRVDAECNGVVYKGDVWSFKTVY